MILRIVTAESRGETKLFVTFNDASRGTVDLLPLLDGPVFESLRHPSRFSEWTLDSVCGTITWPNGADLAPEAIRDLLDTDTPSLRNRLLTTAP